MMQFLPDPGLWHLLLSLPAALYLLGPILVHSSVQAKATPRPRKTTREQMPNDLLPLADIAVVQLQYCGFENPNFIAIEEPSPNQSVTGVVTFHPEGSTGCRWGFYQGGIQKTTYLEFVSMLDDGHWVITNNNKVERAFAPSQISSQANFPERQTVEELWKAHRAHLRLVSRGRTVQVRTEKSIEEDMALAMRQSYEEQVRLGMFHHQTSDDTFRPTWRGAFLMTWRLLFPWKTLTRRLESKRAAEIGRVANQLA